MLNTLYHTVRIRSFEARTVAVACLLLLATFMYSENCYASSGAINPYAANGRIESFSGEPSANSSGPQDPTSNANYMTCQMVSDTNLGISSHISETIVICVESIIKTATRNLLSSLSNYMAPIVMAISILAITVTGARIASGGGDTVPQLMLLIIKLAAINYFSFNLGPFGTILFDIMDDLVNNIPYAIQPWKAMDQFMGGLFGFDGLPTGMTGGRNMLNGTIGMLIASIFSGTAGVMMFSAGILCLIEILFFVMEMVYVYLLAVMALGYCIALSPIIIPLAVFRYSDKYFAKWIKTVIASILIPVMLFTFLSMTYTTINSRIKTLLNDMNPNQHGDQVGNWQGYNGINVFFDHRNLDEYGKYARQDQSLTSWVTEMPKDFIKSVRNVVGTNTTPLSPGVQANMESHSQNSVVVNPYSFWSINMAGHDYHPNNDPTFTSNASMGPLQATMFDFVGLYIFFFVMLGMIRQMPDVARQIADSSISISVQDKPMGARVKEAMDNLKSGTGAIIGSAAGGAAARAVSKNATTREAGGVVGAIAGGLIGNRL